jgi:hypothetical protein
MRHLIKIFPCKLGTTVYIVTSNGLIKKTWVNDIFMSKQLGNLIRTPYDAPRLHPFSEFNHVVFFNKKKAEKEVKKNGAFIGYTE